MWERQYLGGDKNVSSTTPKRGSLGMTGDDRCNVIGINIITEFRNTHEI
jgi:hypothetical protein